MNFSFNSFIDGSFDYDPVSETHTCLWLHEKDMDIGGGKISIDDIDMLKNYPDIDVVTISGLRQDTFEYFIKTYGNQFKAIRFFKNKLVEDWSLLGTLPKLEYIYYFANQKIDKLWDMSNNLSLTGLCIEDFSKLHNIEKINTAPALKSFIIGNAIWNTMTIDSFMPLSNTKIENLTFTGKSITDNDLSFLSSMHNLKSFDFPTNIFSTEKVAWIAANFPKLSGYAINAKLDITTFDSSKDCDVPGVLIVGKRKPSLCIEGNENRINKYVEAFEMMKKKYKGTAYKEVFKD